MRAVIALALVVVICVAFDLNALNSQFYDRVAPPYRSALTVFSADIIEFLANATIPDNSSETRLIAQQLESKVRLFSNHLGQASAACDDIRQQLDARVLQLITDGSSIESQLQQNQQRSAEVQGNITQTEQQIQDADKHTGEAAASVQHADEQVRVAEKRVEDERQHCIGKRSPFNPFDPLDLFKKNPLEVVRDTIIRDTKLLVTVANRVICPVFNSPAITNAKHAREASKQRLADARTRLDQLRAQLANYQQQKTALVSDKSVLESSRMGLHDQLNSTSGERDRIVGINVALKSLITHIGTLLGKSEVFTEVMMRLIDMEIVIGPVEALADQIMGYSGDEQHQGDLEQLIEIKRKIGENLPLVKAKLPLYALVIAE